jgi:hypothetical protein
VSSLSAEMLRVRTGSAACSWPCMDTQFLSHVATRVIESKLDVGQRVAYSCCMRRFGNYFYFRGL